MQDIVLLIFRLGRILTKLQGEVWQSIDPKFAITLNALNSREIRVMIVLALRTLEGNGGLNLNEVAEIAGIKKSAASTMITKLVNAGFISRTENPDNRRSVLITVKPEILRLKETLSPQVIPRIRQAFGCLSDKELKQLISLIDKVYASQNQEEST